jgi:hypothetical protein
VGSFSNAHAETHSSPRVRAVYPHHRATIERLKRDGRQIWNTPNFIWEQLLRSFSTMGNARGVRLMTEPLLHDRVAYDAIVDSGPKKRRAILSTTLAAAPVRVAGRKTDWLCANFERIRRDGGPDAVKVNLCRCAGRDGKIEFLKTFDGIGDKYARNILMDAHHREFRQSIAYDDRLAKIAVALNLKFTRYAAAEEFFLDVAHSTGLSGWELDRLLYHAKDDILQAIGGAGRSTAV